MKRKYVTKKQALLLLELGIRVEVSTVTSKREIKSMYPVPNTAPKLWGKEDKGWHSWWIWEE